MPDKPPGQTVQCANEIDGMRCERWIIPGGQNVPTYRNGRKAWVCRRCHEDAERRAVKCNYGPDPDNIEYRD